MFVQFTWVLNIMQKAFVLCRLFNNEEKSNKAGPAKSNPALSDVTELVQCNNDNDYDKAYVAENQVAVVTSSEVIGHFLCYLFILELRSIVN